MFARIALLATLAATAMATTRLQVTNNCKDQIDPAFFPAASFFSSGQSTGGTTLAPGQTKTVALPTGYNGRVWGRTGCDAAGKCQTGSCTGGISCSEPSAAGPTLAQFTLDGFQQNDFFTPTTADGFNIAVTVTPGSNCSTSAVSCTGKNKGDGCGNTASCPSGSSYIVQFC